MERPSFLSPSAPGAEAALGTDALHFLRTFDGVAPGDYYETYVAVARSFAFSHAVEALAATAVLVLLRSGLAEERRPKRA